MAGQLTRLLAESGRYDVRVACLSGEGPLRAEMERLGLSDIGEYPLKTFYDLPGVIVCDANGKATT